MKYTVSVVTMILLLAACDAAEEKGESGQSSSELQRLLTTFQAEYDVPGLAIVVADDSDILESAAVGIRRVGHDADISPHSRFHLGSISKPITSTVIGALVDSGVVDWDTKIVDLIPELQQTVRPEYAGITLRQLLAHTAGIQPFEEDEEFLKVPDSEGSAREKRLAFTKWLLTLEPVASPGTAHVYSNAGYTIAASVAEHVLDEDFSNITLRYVFEPLSITSGGVGAPSMDSQDELWGHSKSNGEWLATDPSLGLEIRELILPAGDFNMNLLDLAKFGSAHLRGLGGTDDILKSSTFVTIHSEVMDGYALGWNVNDQFDSHSGGLEGMHTAVLLIMKEENRVYAAAVNAEIEDSRIFGHLISELRKSED